MIASGSWRQGAKAIAFCPVGKLPRQELPGPDPIWGKRGIAEGRRLRETAWRDYTATFERACGKMIVLPEEHPPISLSCSERTEKSLRC